MRINDTSRERKPTNRQAEQPEENVAVTAYMVAYSALDYDRDHGSEVEWAAKEMAAQFESTAH